MNHRIRSSWSWLAVAICSLLTSHVSADSGSNKPPTFSQRWRTVLNRQPRGLTLQLELTKTVFEQGEMIPSTLTFSNTSTNRYFTWTGDKDRSGRIPDIAFIAECSNSEPVSDPLGWYFATVSCIGGGGGEYQNLGRWSITLTVNQWLRFDKPGRYRLYAFTSRPREGSAENPYSERREIELVSDVTTIEIRPLTSSRQREILAGIQSDLAKGGESACRAAERLQYLQTPAARRALRRLLGGQYDAYACFGLLGAPDPSAEATALFESLRDPELALARNYFSLYGTLKSYSVWRTAAGEKPQVDDSRRQAEEKIATAARRTLARKRGSALVTTIQSLLFQNPHDTKLRTMLVAHREEMTDAQVQEVIESWCCVGGTNWLGGDDFLPIVRMAALPPRYNIDALGLLAQIAPDEARPIIIEDIERETPRYAPSSEGIYALRGLCALPDRELPQLDSVFQRKLQSNNPNLFTLMPLIAHYASPKLLPDVLTVYQHAEGRWACQIQAAALQYWIRCNPKEGVEALARALKSRRETGCYRNVLSEVLIQNWTEEAGPLVLAALSDDELDVVLSAAQVLERNAPVDVVPEIVSAVERLYRSKAKEQLDWRATTLVTLLLQSKRLVLTQAQLERLAAVTQDSQTRKELLRRIDQNN